MVTALGKALQALCQCIETSNKYLNLLLILGYFLVEPEAAQGFFRCILVGGVKTLIPPVLP